MALSTMVKFRFIFIPVVIVLLINSLVFIMYGFIESYYGYYDFIQIEFLKNDLAGSGAHFLEALDYFVSALVFMIFALGLGQLFIVEKGFQESIPKGLRVGNLKELKVLLWETILVALVIFCVTHLLGSDKLSWSLLPFPMLILILSVALFFVKSKGIGNSE